METGPKQGWISLVTVDCEKWGSHIVTNKNSVLGKEHSAKMKRGPATSSVFPNHESHTKAYKPAGGNVSSRCFRHRAPHSPTVPLPIPSQAAPDSCSQPCSCQPQAQPVHRPLKACGTGDGENRGIATTLKGAPWQDSSWEWTILSQRQLNMSLSRNLLNEVIG